MPWNMLPRELSNEILTQVVETACSSNEPIARYASVCRGWQAFFEWYTFCSLDVTPGDLDTFRSAFQAVQRRRYLQRLGLVLALPQHPPIRFHNSQGDTEEQTALLLMRMIWDGGPGAYYVPPGLKHQHGLDNMSFVSGVSSLFRLLAAWTRDQVSDRGVALEIIADSKSYWQRMAERLRQYGRLSAMHQRPVQNLWMVSGTRFLATSVSWRDWQGPICAAEVDFNFELGLYYGGACGGQGRIARTRGREELFPIVRVITAVSIRRRTVRRFHPEAVRAIVRSLPCLQRLDWQLRPFVTCKSKRPFEHDIVKVLRALPSSLRHVHVTQVQMYLIRCRRRDYECDGVLFRSIWARLSRLESLSLEYHGRTLESYMKNNTTPWPKLERLVFAARGSIGDHPTDDLNRLVRTPPECCYACLGCGS
ncbi:hypothetical protein J3458_001504 [Metarhizium acridum]|uniref:uncharacterized protein n=1 Tax=Metarhizium acridum TaxID=92637 RepID=UPI001C6B9520|nr:hypothetical protein J3458_001504 [Metarhizium acridum]